MRLHFQEKPWDLFVAIAYTVITSASLLAVGQGSLFAIVLVLAVPGYISIATIFPGSTVRGMPEIDWIERIGLSFGLSLAVVPVLSILLNFSPWGIRFAPTVVAIALFTLGASGLAYWRRMRLPPARRLSLTFDLSMNAWREYGRLDRALTFALIAGILLAGGTLGYVILSPQTRETFTEFYLLGPDGNANAYPRNLTVNQTNSIIFGIVNHEVAAVNYTVRVDLVGVLVVYNATSGFNETVEANRTTWSAFSVALADGQNWTGTYAFRINFTGLWKVQFLLFKDTDFLSAYMELHLYVRVT